LARPSYLKPIILTAVNTGMRKAKLLNLEWKDLDFHNKLIYLTDTKGAGKREVPMNNLVYTTLLSIRKRPNSPYVFCHKNGRPYRDLRASLNKAARKARIEAVEVLGRRMDTYMDTKIRHPSGVSSPIPKSYSQ